MAFVLAIPCIQSSIGLGLGPNFICFGHGNYIVGHIPFRVVYFCAANEINTASTGPRESDDATQGIKRGAVRGKTHTHENEMPLRRRKKIVGGAAFAAAGGEISMAEQRELLVPERRAEERREEPATATVTATYACSPHREAHRETPGAHPH